jgi:hypothetical protein
MRIYKEKANLTEVGVGVATIKGTREIITAINRLGALRKDRKVINNYITIIYTENLTTK